MVLHIQVCILSTVGLFHVLQHGTLPQGILVILENTNYPCSVSNGKKVIIKPSEEQREMEGKTQEETTLCHLRTQKLSGLTTRRYRARWIFSHCLPFISNTLLLGI